MVRGVIVTHGNLAAELMETAGRVFGPFEGVVAVTNDGKAPAVLLEELHDVLNVPGDDRHIVFVDFFGGSCCHACLGATDGRDDVQVIAGINLPMLLAFLYKRDDVPFVNLPEEIIRRGQGSIRAVNMESL